MGTAARMTRVRVAAENTFTEPASTASPSQLAAPCHGTLQGRGRLRVTDSKKFLLYGETVLLRSHEFIALLLLLCYILLLFVDLS